MEQLEAELYALNRSSKAINAELQKRKRNVNKRRAQRVSRQAETGHRMHQWLYEIGASAAVSPDGRPEWYPRHIGRSLVTYVMMIFVLAGWDAQVALSYALGIGRQKQQLAPASIRRDTAYCELVVAGIEWMCIFAPDQQIQDMF